MGWYMVLEFKRTQNMIAYPTRYSRVFLLTVLLTWFVALPSGLVSAAPIYLDATQTTYYNFEFFVTSSLTLVPGQTGFLGAQLVNTGTEAATFKPYDPTNPVGGYGWNFNDPGLAIGNGGKGFSGVASTGPVYITSGHVDPVSLQTFPPPNFSNLSNVTINPGQSLSFDLYSLIFPTTVSNGQTGAFTTYNQFAFGDPVFAGWNSSNFTVNLLVGNSFESGPLQQIALANFSFTPGAPPGPSITPEASSLLLLGSGLAGLMLWRRKQPAI